MGSCFGSECYLQRVYMESICENHSPVFEAMNKDKKGTLTNDYKLRLPTNVIYLLIFRKKSNSR